MEAFEYRARRSHRGELARRAGRDRGARAELLGAWRFDVDLVEPMLGAVRLPAGEDAERLAAWALGPAPGLVHSSARSEVEFDRQVLDTVPAMSCGEEQLREAAWYLLARLGEEIRLREGARPRFLRHPQDETVRRFLTGLFEGRPTPNAGRVLRSLYGSTVRRAYAAVCADLGLPPGVAESKVEGALEALEFLAFTSHWSEVVARMVEATDDPVVALAKALDPSGAEVVSRCIGGREAWRRTSGVLAGRVPTEAEVAGQLAVGADLHVFLRLLQHFGSRVPAGGSGTGLPGWLVVSANRGKIRGRLRQVLARSPERLAATVLPLDALYARSEAAMARWAFDWAWREARFDFSYDMDRMGAPACRLPDPVAEAPEAPPLARAEVLTAVLLLVSRGVHEDLLRWVAGAPSVSLSDKFYRYLAEAPAGVADAGSRSRSYARLKDHLDDSLGEYLADVARVAQRVAEVRPARRGMVEALRAALQPDWDAGAVPLPGRDAETIQQNFAVFLARHRSTAAPRRDP